MANSKASITSRSVTKVTASAALPSWWTALTDNKVRTVAEVPRLSKQWRQYGYRTAVSPSSSGHCGQMLFAPGTDEPFCGRAIEAGART